MKFRILPRDIIKSSANKTSLPLIRKRKLKKFSPALLGLGDVSQDAEQVEAICCIVDLAGFTRFCSQVDPYLIIPELLHGFLDWIYREILEESIKDKFPEGATLYTDLPMMSKFMGDGVLFLWDVKKWPHVKISNLIAVMNNIRIHYRKDFYPNALKQMPCPPKTLRCGIARGHVYSVGDGNDFVGPCINIASRLQKYGKFTFAVSQRGIPKLDENYILISGAIRGVSDGENIYVLRREYDKLEEGDKAKYKVL